MANRYLEAVQDAQRTYDAEKVKLEEHYRKEVFERASQARREGVTVDDMLRAGVRIEFIT